jgi:hypothetical protein
MSKFKIGDMVYFKHWGTPFPILYGKIVALNSAPGYYEVKLHRPYANHNIPQSMPYTAPESILHIDELYYTPLMVSLRES